MYLSYSYVTTCSISYGQKDWLTYNQIQMINETKTSFNEHFIASPRSYCLAYYYH